MSAGEMAHAIKNGDFSSEELIKECLKRVDALDDKIEAWAWISHDYALQQAKDADKRLAQGMPLGPLHGIPVGIKDIFATADMPTEYGSSLFAGWQPEEDATVVGLLRAAGAIIFGKTVTAELAFYSPGKTKNPHNSEHTPGGSSSGSAAAVAAGMVPLAIGTQTNGSVIRPAAYCGTVGYKPTHGKIPRHGVLHQSWHLDQIGVFSNTIEDAALLAEQIMFFDQQDPSMRPFARPDIKTASRAPYAGRPRIGFVKSPVWDMAEQETRDVFTQLLERFAGSLPEVHLSQQFDEAVSSHKLIMQADFALSFEHLYERSAPALSPVLRDTIEQGMAVKAYHYNRAVEMIPKLNAELEKIFDEYDVLITPATPGPAPKGLASTGSPIFSTIWTLCGVPAMTLPLLQAKNGLPMGLQLITGKGQDYQLFKGAGWLYRHLNEAS